MAILETGASTSNTLRLEYEVFLSLRQRDVRREFTDILYHALVGVGVCVFVDDEELQPGERISDSLLRAIDDSELCIPIFSTNYASSHRCLHEFAKMVENTSKSREDGNKKVIWPVFYDVDPDDVMLKTESYKNDILQLEQSEEEIEKWRHALGKFDGIKVWDLEKYSSGGELINSVVEEVVNWLKTRRRPVPTHLVRMEVQIAAINNLLDINSGGVPLIGIYGMGGIGKTTLAKIIFNQLCPLFGKNCSFLDVRVRAKRRGLVELQQHLFCNIYNPGVGRKIRNIDDGINMIRDTICNHKVLIVLDDVDEGNQIQNLVGVNSLYPGTRILVTTRDKRVLNIRGFKYKIKHYEMLGLSCDESLQLFSRHAFRDGSAPAEYCALSKGIVSTTGGLPLALEVIGSFLYGEKGERWKETLEKLRKTPLQDVLEKLQVSYDTLETDQQQIFLDVACFFIGQNKIGPISLWEDCGFMAYHAIDVLINMSMIKILDDNSFWMHDQFRYLGRRFAEQEHTRLWDRDNIINELRSTKIKRSVRALSLLADFDSPVTITAEQIKRFPHLQFLRLSNVICRGDLTGCLSKLKWISLHYSHTPKQYQGFEATNLPIENVVVVELSGQEFTVDKVRSLIRGARKLKVLTVCCDPPVKIISQI